MKLARFLLAGHAELPPNIRNGLEVAWLLKQEDRRESRISSEDQAEDIQYMKSYQESQRKSRLAQAGSRSLVRA